MVVKEKIRRYLVLLVTIGFVALVTGLMLGLHLYAERDHKDHDSVHCPICQNLLATAKHYTIEPEIQLNTYPPIHRGTEPNNQLPRPIFALRPSHPRAPPAITCCCLS